MRRVAVTALVLALLGGTAAAFAVTEALKLERAPVTQPRFETTFSPTCGCPTSSATLTFRLRRSDSLDLAIVSDDTTVRTLATDQPYTSGRVRVEWDGRDDSGAIVADGPYRLSVEIADAGRTIVFPKEVVVDTQPPAAEVVDAGPPAFSPDGDGRRDVVRVVYRADEDTAPVLLVDGRIALDGVLKRKRERRVWWNGTIDGRPARTGVYTVSLRVRDRAGNLSEPVEALSVELRFVDVVPGSLVARRGKRVRFRAVSDAATISWELRTPRGRVVLADEKAKPGVVTVRLPERIRPGRYRLDVSANGYRDTAVVRVVKRRT